MKSPIGFRTGAGFAAIPALRSPGHVLGVAITPAAAARAVLATAGAWLWLAGRVLEHVGDIIITVAGGES